MTAHIHSSATSKSTLFKRLVIFTIVASVLIYLAFTFSLFSVPTKFQKQSAASLEVASPNGGEKQQQGRPHGVADADAVVEVKKPAGIIVQTKQEEKPSSNKQVEELEEKHEDLNSVPPQQPVQELNGNTFDDFIKSSPNALVYVFSPTCPHCVQFSPTFDKLVGEMGKIYGGNVNIGKVVGPKNIDTLVIPLGVRGYPTLMFYTKGDLKSKKFYEGARKIPEILAFIEKQIKQ